MVTCAGFSGCWQNGIRINDNSVSIREYTVSLSDVRLDGCPDVIDASSSCMTSSPIDVSEGVELSAVDNGLRPFTGLFHRDIVIVIRYWSENASGRLA